MTEAELVRLPEALSKALDALPVRLVVEYLGERLDLDDGNQRVAFYLTSGHFARLK